MPLNLPPLIVKEKNKISSIHPFFMLLDITLTDNTKFYLVHNTEDITFNGQVYIAFPFQVELPKISSKGEIPTWTIRVSNVTRVLQASLEALNGAVGSTIVMRIVNAGFLNENYAELETTLKVLATQCDAYWVTFTLGGENLLRRRFPLYRYIANYCPWVSRFKQADNVECGYSGPATTCNGTLANCRLKGNSRRFGGKVGLSNIGVRLV